MLYNPNWEQKTKTDPLTLPALIAWLELQPADETYCYVDTGECLIAQYLNAQGIRISSVSPDHYCDADRVPHPMPLHFDSIANGKDAGDLNTFGRALARARAALGD